VHVAQTHELSSPSRADLFASFAFVSGLPQEAAPKMLALAMPRWRVRS
jgi:hypothetical protein